MNPHRLYFSVDDMSGEISGIMSLVYSGPHYNTISPTFSDHGTVDVVFEPDVETLAGVWSLFDKAQRVMWTLELDNGYEWWFDAYIRDMEITSGLKDRRAAFKLAVVGVVTLNAFFDSPVVDNSPVFTKRAHRQQADNLASVLQLVTQGIS